MVAVIQIFRITAICVLHYCKKEKNNYNKTKVGRLITERRDVMSLTESFKSFYEVCKKMNIEDTVEVALNAESEEEQEFVELITNFFMEKRQKEVIAQGKF